MTTDHQVILPATIQAVIFDMDGVITDTADAHAAAWQRLFDDFRAERIARGEPAFEPFDEAAYRRYVDGKPRYEGLNSFLTARGIQLDWGDADDPPDRATVCGLGNRKNGYFNDWLAENGAKTYDDGVDLLDRLDRAGIKVGVFSSSRNAAAVLQSAGIAARFAARTDGTDLARHDLAGKPAPDMLIETARRLGADPAHTAVLEDATSGVEAGRRGGFALVVGVDRNGGNAKALADTGAHRVVSDLGAVRVADDRQSDGDPGPRPISAVGDVWDSRAAILRRIDGRRVALFLDFDGTLAPIVDDPDKANLPPGTGDVVARLAGHMPLAVISGRGLDDVRGRVGLDNVYYAGSHGFELAGPDGWTDQVDQAARFLPALDAAEASLRQALSSIAGARVERKRYSIATHYRQVADSDVSAVEVAVDDAVAGHQGLVKESGKKIFEIQPDMDWDKGHAVEVLLDRLGLADRSALAIYIGDDVTDEDAFRVLAGRGLTIVVRGEDDERRTLADHALADTDDVRRFLSFLADNLPDLETRGPQ